MATRPTSSAPLVWRQLNGIISVFKPAGVKSSAVKYTVIGNLVRDLNQMEVRAPRQMLSIEPISSSMSRLPALAQTPAASPLLSGIADSLSGSSSANAALQPAAYKVSVGTDLSDHVLAVGPRYEIGDVRCNVVHTLGLNTSGVLLLGLNAGTRTAFHLARSRLLRTYHVHGRLGTATEDNFAGTRITHTVSHRHVHADRLAGLLASLQASHQQRMYELCGVDAQSQAAYELAAGGLIRPADRHLPLLYGIRLHAFDRTSEAAGGDFTLEVHALNETERYFGELVQEIGVQLHTVAHCRAVRCVRHGHFDVAGALLRNRWSVQGVVDSVRDSGRLLERHPEMLRPGMEVGVREAPAMAVGAW